MYARLSELSTFNPAALTLSTDIERTASPLQPETLHFSPLSIRPNNSHAHVMFYLPLLYCYCLSSFSYSRFALR